MKYHDYVVNLGVDNSPVAIDPAWVGDVWDLDHRDTSGVCFALLKVAYNLDVSEPQSIREELESLEYYCEVLRERLE